MMTELVQANANMMTWKKCIVYTESFDVIQPITDTAVWKRG
jgi:hypothetical protein